MSDIQPQQNPFSSEAALSRCNLSSPKLVIRLDPNAEEIIAGRRHYLRKRFAKKVFLYEIGLLIAVYLFALFTSPDLPLINALKLYGLIFTVCALLLPGCLLLNERGYERFIRRTYQNTPKEQQPIGYFILSQEGYAVIEADRGETWRWAAVREIVFAGSLVLLLNDRGEVHVVTRRMFDQEEEFAKFTKLLTDYYNESKTTPVSTPRTPTS